MVVTKPSTLEELHRFYAEEFTPLYNRFQNLGRIPQEISAEIAADAFAELETDPTVVRAAGKSRRQKRIALARDIAVGILAGVATTFLLRLFRVA